MEAVGEPQDDGFIAGSVDGMPIEAEARHNEPPPEDTAGADMHFEQVTGNGQITDPSGPLVGSMPGSVEASATVSIGNLVPAAVLPVQLLYVSGAHVSALGAMPGDRSHLPDPSELYTLPRMPYPRMGYSPAVG